MIEFTIRLLRKMWNRAGMRCCSLPLDRKWAMLGVLGGAVLLPLSGESFGEHAGPVGIAGQWTPVFSDEFNGKALDRNKWTTCFWWDDHGCTNLAGQEMSWYLPENVEVDRGFLHLIARQKTVRGYKDMLFPYTSGMVTTGRDFADRAKPSRFDINYGYIEIRAKLPTGRGLWPAIWLLPSTQEPLPEIDIMEMLGHAPSVLQMHLHYRDGDGKQLAPGYAANTSDLSTFWHVYGLKWTESELVWYLDGAEMWRRDDFASIPHKPMYLLINLAVGGKWPGKPSRETKFPAEMLVDYVRVWKSVK